MTQVIAILGRQPALGLAELESLFGAESVTPIGNVAALLDIEPKDFPMLRLGGTMKAGKFLTELPYTDWQKIEAYLSQELPRHAEMLPEGKVRLGINVHGLPVSVRRLNATGLALKKAVKASGRSVRVVPNNAPELNSAQIIHNQLTGPSGIDLLLVKNGNKTILAQTFAVQDIEAYAARDQARPKRDARVGMLPPKLAQIILNLAVGKRDKLETTPPPTVLDPFCGTGVVLQEALLMGYRTYGTDLEPRMAEYSQENLSWLEQKWNLEAGRWNVRAADATSFTWESLDSIACETYLGQPFSAEPRPEKLQQVMQDVDTIHRKFLKNVARQTNPGLRLCIAVPAWKTKNGFKHLKTLDSLEELGYTRISFAHVSSKDLLYYRNDQIVARELVVLIRK